MREPRYARATTTENPTCLRSISLPTGRARCERPTTCRRFSRLQAPQRATAPRVTSLHRCRRIPLWDPCRYPQGFRRPIALLRPQATCRPPLQFHPRGWSTAVTSPTLSVPIPRVRQMTPPSLLPFPLRVCYRRSQRSETGAIDVVLQAVSLPSIKRRWSRRSGAACRQRCEIHECTFGTSGRGAGTHE